MGKDFTDPHDATVTATPDQVWHAVATGPGISAWFVGRTDVDDTRVRTAFGDDLMPPGDITARDEPRHFAHRSPTGPGGRFVASEYLIEGRDHASTTLRLVTSGFLPGDDWADEYEAMRHGTALFFATLVEHLNHFPGRTPTPVTTFGPPVTDWDHTWNTLHRRLGITDPRPGTPVPAVGGTVYHRNPHTLAVRTPNALYRFLRGHHGSMITAQSLYTPDAPHLEGPA